MRATPALLALGLVASAALLGACAPEPASGPETRGADEGAPSASASAATPAPTPTLVALPKDCRAILSPEVLAQLAGVPLNDPAFGAAGVQADGSLRCVWATPGSDTTSLTTEVSYLNRGPALDMLNRLQKDNGFTCFTPDDGTRCEKTWQDGVHPVTDGRTLFWRDGVLVDTRYSNLAPEGYTSSIVAHLWG